MRLGTDQLDQAARAFYTLQLPSLPNETIYAWLLAEMNPQICQKLCEEITSRGQEA